MRSKHTINCLLHVHVSDGISDKDIEIAAKEGAKAMMETLTKRGKSTSLKSGLAGSSTGRGSRARRINRRPDDSAGGKA